MIIKGVDTYRSLIIRMLEKSPKVGITRMRFLVEIIILFLSIRGRINFLQLSRFGKRSEQSYRKHFEKKFAFMDFNKELTLSNDSGHYVIAFDPSYISKSGKETLGTGMYWSGCAGKCKWGIEIGGIAAIHVGNHTAFHLEAVQTLRDKENEGQTLMGWYADLLEERKEKLRGIFKHVVCDAWFSKKPFVDRVVGMEMYIVSRLRDDAALKYPYLGKPTDKRGRPKKYNGKIDVRNPDASYFTMLPETDEFTAHSAVVYSKAMEMDILLVIVKYKSRKQPVKLYFTTDLGLKPELVVTYYKLRFQIEFLYRDGKQSTGLNHCQARSENKLDFHFNASLTAINVAKVGDWLSITKEARPPFSITKIKTVNHNRLLLKRFFDVFGISPNIAKNQKHFKELLLFGTLAA